MKPITIWIRKATAVFIGGEGDKPVPVITAELTNPQVIIDTEKGIITIVETK